MNDLNIPCLTFRPKAPIRGGYDMNAGQTMRAGIVMGLFCPSSSSSHGFRRARKRAKQRSSAPLLQAFGQKRKSAASHAPPSTAPFKA